MAPQELPNIPAFLLYLGLLALNTLEFLAAVAILFWLLQKILGWTLTQSTCSLLALAATFQLWSTFNIPFSEPLSKIPAFIWLAAKAPPILTGLAALKALFQDIPNSILTRVKKKSPQKAQPIKPWQKS